MLQCQAVNSSQDTAPAARSPAAHPALQLRSLAGDRTLLLASSFRFPAPVPKSFWLSPSTSKPSCLNPVFPSRATPEDAVFSFRTSRCSPYLPRTHVAQLFLLPQPPPSCTASPGLLLAGKTQPCQHQECCGQAPSQAYATQQQRLVHPQRLPLTQPDRSPQNWDICWRLPLTSLPFGHGHTTPRRPTGGSPPPPASPCTADTRRGGV